MKIPKFKGASILPIILLIAGGLTIYTFISGNQNLNEKFSDEPRGRFSNAYYPPRRAGVRLR